MTTGEAELAYQSCAKAEGAPMYYVLHGCSIKYPSWSKLPVTTLHYGVTFAILRLAQDLTR